MADDSKALTPLDSDAIGAAILNIRGERVMLDRDLAAFYRVKPIALRQAVKRNPEKFPADIMFQLTAEEAALLVSQSVIPSRRSLGGALPYVFTEHGALQLSSVLRSPRATQVGLFIVRVFVRVRQLLIHDTETAKRLVLMPVDVVPLRTASA